MTKFMFDTNCFYQITENQLNIINSDENEYYVTPIQLRELNEAKKIGEQRKKRLLNLFNRINQEKKDLRTGLLGHQEAGQFPFVLGSAGKYDEFKRDLDDLRKEPNNIEDALIAETAVVNGITLITSDRNLLKVVNAHYPELVISLDDYKKKYLWRFDKLGKHVELIKGISYRSEDYCNPNEGFIFINLKCVERNGGFRRDGIKFYKGKVKNNQFINKGDILIANTDITQNREVIGCPIRIPEIQTNKNIVFSLDLSKLEIISDEINYNFLYYYLLSPNARNFMISNSNGTTVMHLSTKNVPNMVIPIPPLPEQKAIAKVLSDLDDKIELNNEMNKTLEEIGQALFKRWFIDFEFPDENGNPYRSSGGEMVYSKELGKEIPKGWEVDKLGNHVNLVKGVSYRSEELTESENALVTLKSIDRKGNFKIDGLKEYVGKYKDEQILFSGDIVVAHTDLTQKADVLGNPAIVREVSKYEKLIASLDLVIVRPKNEYINRPFIYHLLKTNAFHNHAIGYANGTTVLHLNHKAIPDFEFVVPSFTIIKNFGENINQITLKLQDNELQSECLAQIRDFILPKLMSGEIRVPLEAIQ